MRTAIFVYESTAINISTCETDLQLFAMGGEPVALAVGNSAHTIAPGIYMIVSSQDVSVVGDNAAIDVVVTTHNKDNDPTVPPLRATQNFAALDNSALKQFLAVPESKSAANI